MKKKKLLFVFGTRPEAIKMAPLVHEAKKHQNVLDCKVCVTAQHRQMLDQVLQFFEIQPEYDLNLMQPGQDLYKLTANVLIGIKPVLEEFMPDYVFVHGDTTTSSAVALGAYYNRTKVCHVEAGLRTNNKYAPFPEEINRQITARLTDLHFAPTETARQNLLKEAVLSDNIIVTGNTVIDALLYAKDRVEEVFNEEIEDLKKIVHAEKHLILVTGHRRENFGDGFINICQALKELSVKDNVQVIYPVHLNPNVQKPVSDILGNCANVSLLAPLSYPAFIWLMKRAKVILTDSGGIQEEAPSLRKPVLVMRDTTERPEAIAAGTVILVGTNKQKIIEEVTRALEKRNDYEVGHEIENPYGDGRAAERIMQKILNSIK